MEKTLVVGKPQVKVDAQKLVRGRPVFTDDLRLEGMLYGALLTSPHAHARIKHIDASRARALPGVHAVLTYRTATGQIRFRWAELPSTAPLRPGLPGQQGAPRR